MKQAILGGCIFIGGCILFGIGVLGLADGQLQAGIMKLALYPGLGFMIGGLIAGAAGVRKKEERQ